MDIKIFIAAHKKFTPPQENIYIPLHVGREGKEDFGYIGDNTGEHISEKNPNYCELTGMYWMWKNVTCDVIGLCHYRRYFVQNDTILTKNYIEQVMNGYDMIIGNSSMSPHGSVEEHYIHQHGKQDLEICRQVLEQLAPDYLEAYDWCMTSNLMNLGNMVITTKKLYDAYCAWLFPILFEIEKQTDISGYDTYQARIYGFLSERLFRVWITQQEIRVREEEIRQIEG